MLKLRSVKKILTHAGSAHIDEFWACCLACHMWPGTVLERIEELSPEDRDDPEVLVLDLGGETDSNKLLFDHHGMPTLSLEEDMYPHCTFTLFLQYLGKIDRAREFLPWLDYMAVVDHLGPEAGGYYRLNHRDESWRPAWQYHRGCVAQGMSDTDALVVVLGVLPENKFFPDMLSFRRSQSGLEKMVLEQFSEIKQLPPASGDTDQLSPGDLDLRVLRHMMALLGEDVLQKLDKTQNRLERLAEPGVVMFGNVGNHEVMFSLAVSGEEDPTLATELFVAREGTDTRVIVGNDACGPGHSLQRVGSGHFDFYRLVNDPRIGFAATSGFVAKTRGPLPQSEIEELILMAAIG